MKTSLVICAVLLALPCTTLATTIPDTGQTKCYNNSVEITCPNPGEDFYGQDAQYGPNLQSFTKLDENGNNLPDDAPWPWAMVRDNVTGLIWEVKTDDGSIHDKDNEYVWDNAQSIFIATLNSQNFGDHDDWRLPTAKELSSLVDLSIPDPGPTINIDYFPNTDLRYWSSTTCACNPGYAWVVDFRDGKVDDNSKSYSFYVRARAVRGGQWGSNNFIDNGDGTITDTSTGLMWEVKTDDGGPRDKDNIYEWQQALSYCENLTLAGYDDWRLPNRNELQSIVDYSRCNPSIDPIFTYTVPWNYWSSTTDAYHPYRACDFYFDIGYESDGPKRQWVPGLGELVRAVRGGQCDLDGDGIPNDGDGSGVSGDNPCTGGQTAHCDDNCIDDYNPFQIDCDNDGTGDACDADTIDNDGDLIDDGEGEGHGCDNCPATSNPNQEDSHPPQKNGLGDACDCEGNFDCNTTVDGLDAATFKADFGRGSINSPCTTAEPCHGDFICNGTVDGLDAALFKSDFGRSGINRPCPNYVTDPWCVYP